MAVDPARENSLFLIASEMSDQAERAAFLDRECGGDDKLRQRVEALLAANATVTPFPASDSSVTYASNEPAAMASTVAVEENAHSPSETATEIGRPDSRDAADITFAGSMTEFRKAGFVGGQVIAGRYRLLEIIGEGGMGTVYRAGQTTPVKRQVALKLIKVGKISRDVLARFDAERQALALMDHPNIARIYDGGVTEAGQPFFVMELVDGVPLTDYCDHKRLKIEERLALFVSVCQAVQHAHQKGIIHRDLKPSNVLVTEVDGRPTPKVIDFGVAKATEQKLTDMSFVDTGSIVGTPTYMSPEQADPTSMDIDTRTDIYSLGVMLYELLVGSPPLDARDFRTGAVLEMLRMVREVDPPRPSTKLSSADALPNIAARRNIEPARLSKLLQGELDWVVMKALEKDRNRRYDTANGLARDLQRYLADEVVEARPPSRSYRIRKFVRRHRGQVIAASLVFMTLVAGAVGTTIGMFEAREQKAIAEANLKKSDENFQLAQRNQKNSEENYRLARDAVDRYLTQVSENRLLNEPYMDKLRLELLGSAREFYQAFADRRRDDPAAAQDLAIAHSKLAEIEWRLGKNESAFEELEISRKAMLAADPAATTALPVLQSGGRLSSYQLQLGRFDQALSTATQTLQDAETAAKHHAGDPLFQNVLERILIQRGQIYRRKNQKAEAIADFERAAEILERLVRDHPDVREQARDLANTYMHRGYMASDLQKDDEADTWHRKSLAIHRRITEAEPELLEARESLAVAISNVSLVLRRKKRFAEAIAMIQETVDIYRTLEREHPGVAGYKSSLASALSNLSVIHKSSGDFGKAKLLNKQAIDTLLQITRQFPAVTQPVMALGMAEGNEGNNELDARNWVAAIAWFDRSNATLEPLLKKSNDPRIRSVLRNNHWGRADAMVAQSKFTDAIAAYDSAISMAEDRIRPELRLARALALAKSGDHQAASAAVDAETAVDSAGKFIWFDASKVLVVAAEAAKDNPQTLEDLQSRAVVALRRAFESGYFVDAKTRAQLRSTDFATLLAREDFRKLVADVDAKATDSPKPASAQIKK